MGSCMSYHSCYAQDSVRSYNTRGKFIGAARCYVGVVRRVSFCMGALLGTDWLLFILPSLTKHSMHYLPYTKSRWLTNTPTRSGALCSHLQGVPSQLLTLRVKWFQKLTAEIVFPEDGAGEQRKASEYYSNSVTVCMKDSAMSVG